MRAVTFAALLTLSAQANTVARVIYSEASAICSAQERELVASCVFNRVNHSAFGAPRSALGVVTSRNAFEALCHAKNTNWRQSATPDRMARNARKAYRHAEALAHGIFRQRDKRVLFFMTKGVTPPPTYVARRYWTLRKVKTTKHFDFYTIIPKPTL